MAQLVHWWDDFQRHGFFVAVLLACTWLCLFAMETSGFVGPWHSLESVMNGSIGAPFVHRILFVWVAKFFAVIFPELGYLRCFYLSQIVALLLAFFAVRQWVALFVPDRIAFIGPVIAAAILVPTIRYHTFYDFGIVFFYAICLFLLFTERHGAYLFFFTLGTLNHEIVLLLVAVFFLLHFDGRMSKTTFWGLIALQLISHILVRSLLMVLIAWEDWHSLTIERNLESMSDLSATLAWRALFSAFWYIVAAFGYSSAPKRLRRAALLLPMLVTTTFVFGQFHELRQFDAFIPVLAALILCRANLDGEKRPHETTSMRDAIVQLPIAIVLAVGLYAFIEYRIG